MAKYLFFFLIVLAGCRQHTADKKENNSPVAIHEKQRIRYGMVTGLKPEKLSYYKELHAKPWPAVLAKIKECNIENYSIYMQKIENRYYLFSYFEYTGNDFDADMKKNGIRYDNTTVVERNRPLPVAFAGSFKPNTRSGQKWMSCFTQIKK
jgi:L-rhamnose mutarotase